ncbi:MAG: urea transporter permease, partial [Verrucomicrobiaceae bacterium]|nr:urea transporter permease [Verrucomicrobiaceae bacterium]
LLLCALSAKYIVNTRFGRVLVAIRDREDRVRFSGYNVAVIRAFTFALAALFAGIGGALFVLQVGFMSPSIIGIVPSIEMVIFTAVGGRLSVIGGICGALIVNFGKTTFSEAFPDLWLFLMGGTFIAVVMFFPNGLAGLIESPWVQARLAPLWKLLPPSWRGSSKPPPAEEDEESGINLNTTEVTK